MNLRKIIVFMRLFRKSIICENSYRGCEKMSRSYKKTPVFTGGIKNGGKRKYWKRQANKKIRKTNGFNKKSKKYKKAYESWDIRDYRFYENKNCIMDDDDVRRWEKYYHRK